MVQTCFSPAVDSEKLFSSPSVCTVRKKLFSLSSACTVSIFPSPPYTLNTFHIACLSTQWYVVSKSIKSAFPTFLQKLFHQIHEGGNLIHIFFILIAPCSSCTSLPAIIFSLSTITVPYIMRITLWLPFTLLFPFPLFSGIFKLIFQSADAFPFYTIMHVCHISSITVCPSYFIISPHTPSIPDASLFFTFFSGSHTYIFLPY